MTRLRVVPDLPAEEPGPPRTLGQLFTSLGHHLRIGGEGLEFRLADLAQDYAEVPLPDPKR